MDWILNGMSITETEIIGYSWGRVGVPVIFASGYTDNLLGSYDELEFETGFLQKPFDRPTLLRAVRKALDRRSGPDR